MKKILITLGLVLFATNFAFSNETKCSDLKKKLLKFKNSKSHKEYKEN